MTRSWLALVALLPVLACSGDDPRVEACRQRMPTVTSGVFGCVTESDDVGTGGRGSR
jgi:hypothetical protein